jgi:uncharacterized membrane protein
MISTRLLTHWESLRTSFWFIPSIMVCVATGLAKLLLIFDHYGYQAPAKFLQYFYETTPESARALLTTIANSMITVTSIAFSITVVALTLASSQFGPRLIRNFMMDKGTQVVLGVFVSTYLYCLLIIQATKSFDKQVFVPGMSVYVAVILAFVSVAVLIFFIHHVARSIQADNVIDNVYCELRESIDRLFPDIEESDEDSNMHSLQYQQNYPSRFEIKTPVSGYVQALDLDHIVSMGQKFDMVVEVKFKPGDFIIKNSVLLVVYCHSNQLPLVEDKLLQVIIQGSNRTPVQDPEFAVHQLVEIAVRALSPGINDPYSAITCVDKLSAILCELCTRPFPNSRRFDDSGAIRVTINGIKFSGLAEAAFNQIRQYGKGSVAVTIRLLESLDNLVQASINDEQREFASHQLQMIEQAQAGQSLPTGDQADIAQGVDKIKASLSRKGLVTGHTNV